MIRIVLNLFVIILGILRIELIIVNWEFYFFVFFIKILVVYILIYLEKFVDIIMMIFNWFFFFLVYVFINFVFYLENLFYN